ncbi:uncharacterized protein G2W53_030812 [Senna tora]|uniref:Uncharacterized protein n=1 Tax=Senna tora TaxID=362788 RepID=A0A834WDB3_9FABA|nr:uncharacterized protein G2W53_030812 [Senna tora]
MGKQLGFGKSPKRSNPLIVLRPLNNA